MSLGRKPRPKSGPRDRGAHLGNIFPDSDAGGSNNGTSTGTSIGTSTGTSTDTSTGTSTGTSTDTSTSTSTSTSAGTGTGSGAICYMDNNSTTHMPAEVVDTYVRWCNRGNPSASYGSAVEARQMMEKFRAEIAVECAFELSEFEIVFTSGGSESNSHIIASSVRAFLRRTSTLPHIITSAAEHKSLLMCCQQHAEDGLCQLTVLPVRTQGPAIGTVDPDELAKAIRPNTCLVSIMAANGETGIMNNIPALTAATRKHRGIPFHTDAVQLFGKSALRPDILGVDAFSASFHKLHGPAGVGILVIRRTFATGYGLGPLISGTQNRGLRGGTENTPGIAAAFTAFRLTMANRGAKTAAILQLRAAIKAAISRRVPCFPLSAHPGDPPPSIDGGITPPPPAHSGTAEARRAIAAAEKADTPVVFWIAPDDDRAVLPNTILLAVRRRGFSNRAALAALARLGVIVSLGSACDAASPAPSGVVVAMGVPVALQSGVLRVSLGDMNTAEDVKVFIRAFISVISGDACRPSEQ